MVDECESWQKSYLTEFKKYFKESRNEEIDIVEETIEEKEEAPITPQPQPQTEQEWAFGYKEIMDTFHWGRNKVAQFVKNDKYRDAICKEGNKVAVNIALARQLMKPNTPKKRKVKE